MSQQADNPANTELGKLVTGIRQAFVRGKYPSIANVRNLARCGSESQIARAIVSYIVRTALTSDTKSPDASTPITLGTLVPLWAATFIHLHRDSEERRRHDQARVEGLEKQVQRYAGETKKWEIHCASLQESLGKQNSALHQQTSELARAKAEIDDYASREETLQGQLLAMQKAIEVKGDELAHCQSELDRERQDRDFLLEFARRRDKPPELPSQRRHIISQAKTPAAASNDEPPLLTSRIDATSLPRFRPSESSTDFSASDLELLEETSKFTEPESHESGRE